MKIVLVFGTRPEVIKLWPLILELEKSKHEITIISTGQQRGILNETLFDLEITPNFNLDIMQESLSLSEFFTAAYVGIGKILELVQPSIVVVQGDTSSALAGALSAHFLGIPVGHVEAGLRSGDLTAPWPEEGNRRLIDSISTLLWTPTKGEKILKENDQIVSSTGNTVIDSLRLITESKALKKDKRDFILVTLHRRESFGSQMVTAMKEIVNLSDLVANEIIFIQHPNPKVQSAISESQMDKSQIRIIKPLPYTEFISMLRNTSLLITDSGGLQEEAYSLGVPLVVVRDNTERVEALCGNMGLLVGGDGRGLISKAIELLNSNTRRVTELSSNEFGNGFAAQKIIDSLENWYGSKVD